MPGIIFFSLLIFLFGLIIGSFLNVVIFRLNHKPVGKKTGIFGGRSFCPHCKKTIAWHDNLPLLSFVCLKGRCRYCHSSISWQYPLVELGTALLFLAVSHFWSALPSPGCLFLVYQLFLISVLVVIFVSDWLYFIIPDEIVFLGLGVSFLWRLWLNSNLGEYLLAGLGGALFFLFLVWLTHGKGMGGGDVKLAGLMGLVLGWPGILIAFYWAFLTGAFWGVILILSGRKRFGEQVPFGPFLVFGTVVTLFWGERIWQLINVLLL